MDTKARQLIADIWLGQKLTQVELDHVISVIRSEFTVLREFEHQYTPYGLTKVFILSESHCIIHTYPEQNFISIDFSNLLPTVILRNSEVKKHSAANPKNNFAALL